MVFKNKTNEEKQWIKKCIRGEKKYFRYIIERYERMIRTVIFRLINNIYDVDDLAQETFITAYNRLSQFSGKSQFSTWLCQIALNKTRDFLRANKRQDKKASEIKYNCDKHMETPENLMLNKDKSKLINKALQKMRQDDKELIIFKYMYGHNYKYIAEIFSCAPETVKVRCLRARNSLKEILLSMEVTL